MTSDTTVVPLRQPETIDDPLTAILRSGARRLLAQALETIGDLVAIWVHSTIYIHAKPLRDSRRAKTLQIGMDLHEKVEHVDALTSGYRRRSQSSGRRGTMLAPRRRKLPRDSLPGRPAPRR